MIKKWSTRAEIVYRRTYSRPLEDGIFETWEDTVDRVIGHQQWLWERALTHKILPGMPLKDVTDNLMEWVCLNDAQLKELSELKHLMIHRKVVTSGRSLWLAGTEVSRKQEASQFNCAAKYVETVYDVVDLFHLLLMGSGTGFKAVIGSLTGFRNIIPEIEVIKSTRSAYAKGRETNEETFINGVWTIQIGDSARAWATSIGKILAGKYKANKLIIDLTKIRGPGARLAGFGWISSGSEPLGRAMVNIFDILNKKAGCLLSKIDILDVMNHLGTVLSSRRSAQIAFVDYGSLEWEEFADAKKDCFSDPYTHRQQSNNSIIFQQKPNPKELRKIFDRMIKNGGSEPGFINGVALKERAPYAELLNPCAEVALSASGGFCCLTETDVTKFVGDTAGLLHALHLISRANYRQTVVDFDDGILQESWKLNNDFQHLCGVSLTGVARRDDLTSYDLRRMRDAAISGVNSMAYELGLPRPANTTVQKPSGSVSKVMDSWEGIHKPLGRYILNWILFSEDDPMLIALANAGYDIIQHPTQIESRLVCVPVDNGDYFDKVEITRKDGSIEILEINTESAIVQLERYKKYMTWWTDMNTSNTISYDINEVDDIIEWLLNNWSTYVGVSFLFRTDPTKCAADLGYPYLPQEVISKDHYNNYMNRLIEIDWDNTESFEEVDSGEECSTGVCPMK